jgi:hypothetical protein
MINFHVESEGNCEPNLTKLKAKKRFFVQPYCFFARPETWIKSTNRVEDVASNGHVGSNHSLAASFLKRSGVSEHTRVLSRHPLSLQRRRNSHSPGYGIGLLPCDRLYHLFNPVSRDAYVIICKKKDIPICCPDGFVQSY